MLPEFNHIALPYFQAFTIVDSAIIFYFAFSYYNLRLAAGLHQVGGFKQLYQRYIFAG